MRSLLLLVALVPTAAALAPLAHAQERTVPIVLRLPASTRALGVGNAFVADGSDTDAVFYNPALVADAGGASLSWERYGDESRLLTASTTVDVRYGALGFGGQSLEYRSDSPWPGDVIANSDLLREMRYASASLAATAAFARASGPIRYGVGAKLLQRRVGPERGLGFAADVGAAWVGRRLTISAAIQNVGPDLEIDLGRLPSVHLPLPTRATVNATTGPHAIGPLDIALPASLIVREDRSLVPAVGVEVEYAPSLFGWQVVARAGVRDDPDGGASPYTFGIGVGRDRLVLDYAYDGMGSAGGAHRIGVRW